MGDIGGKLSPLFPVEGSDSLYQPESAYFECVHEMKLIIDLINKAGFAGMRYSISDTAEYGDYITGDKIITQQIRDNMKQVLDDIQTGVFAREWINENKTGRPYFNKVREEEARHPVEQVGKELRAKMNWDTAIEEK